MRTRFPGSLQHDAAGEVVRVLVENGVGTPGLVEQARASWSTTASASSTAATPPSSAREERWC